MPDATLPLGDTGLVPADPAALTHILDQVVDLAWEPGWAPLALSRLVTLCARLRDGHDEAGWTTAQEVLLAHPIRRLLHEDPLIRYSFEREGRDQPGLLDILLEHPAAELGSLSRAGLDLFTATTELSHFAALRAENRYLARVVDAAVEWRKGAELMTLGAGHLREASLVTQRAAILRWVAQEREHQTLVALRQGAPCDLPVRVLRCGVASFIRRPFMRGCFDLILLPRLPDDAPAGQMRNFLDAAFAAVKPGGLLLLGSAAEAPPEAAWMEAFMRLRPQWRTPEEVLDLLSAIPMKSVANRRVFRSPDCRRVYAMLERRR